MNAARHLRLVGILEGISYLVLLLVAMPLKYLLGYPLPVRIVGSIHGLLFLWFVAALFFAHRECRWSILTSIQLFIASLVPFGFVFVDGKLRQQIAASSAEANDARL